MRFPQPVSTGGTKELIKNEQLLTSHLSKRLRILVPGSNSRDSNRPCAPPLLIVTVPILDHQKGYHHEPQKQPSETSEETSAP
jgi:hypothetical protein